MKEAGSEPFGLDANQSRTDEWSSGSIQKTPPDANSRSYNLGISVRAAIPACGHRSLKPLCNDDCVSCMSCSPSDLYFSWYGSDRLYLPLPHKRSDHAAVTDSDTSAIQWSSSWLILICYYRSVLLHYVWKLQFCQVTLCQVNRATSGVWLSCAYTSSSRILTSTFWQVMALVMYSMLLSLQ